MNALRVDGYHEDNEFNNSVVGDDELIENSFVDHRGLIEFRIYLRNKSLDKDEELNFEIVFTPFRGEYKIICNNIIISRLLSEGAFCRIIFRTGAK